MKHIGIVVPSFHIPSETFVVTEINALVKAGHKVSVITFENLNTSAHLDSSVNVIIIKRSFSAAAKFAKLYSIFKLNKVFNDHIEHTGTKHIAKITNIAAKSITQPSLFDFTYCSSSFSSQVKYLSKKRS